MQSNNICPTFIAIKNNKVDNLVEETSQLPFISYCQITHSSVHILAKQFQTAQPLQVLSLIRVEHQH